MGNPDNKIRETNNEPVLLSPQPIVTIRRDPRCSTGGLNKTHTGEILAKLDIDNVGFDKLAGDYLVGTDHASTHLLYFMIEGSAWAISRSFRQKIRPGDVFVAPAGQAAWIELKKDSAKAVWIHLRDTEQWRFLKHEQPGIHPAEYTKGIGAITELMQREQVLNRPGYETITQHYAEILILYLKQETGDWGTPAERLARQRLTRLRSELSGRVSEEWTVEQMAMACNISAGHLHLLTKQYENKTPMEVLRQIRMEHAIFLLLSTTQTIDAIAAQVGYHTPYSFSDAFQRYTGKRPGTYRRNNA